MIRNSRRVNPLVSVANPNKPPLLLVGNFLSADLGRRNVCEDLADRLVGADWPVLTTSAKRGCYARALDMVCTAWKSRQQYAAAHVDVFSGRAFFWAEAVCWVLRACGKPYGLTLRGGDLPRFAKRHERRVRALLGNANVVTTPSRYLLEKLCCFQPGIRLLANPIELNRYDYWPRCRPKPRLVWLRAFHDVYNPGLAVSTTASLAREFHDVELRMIGPDTGDGSLQMTSNRIRECNLSHRITLLGPAAKTDVPGYLRQGDIFLNTANVDNTPVSVLEAMACGLCVVSTDVGGMRYLLRHEHDALLVPSNDPDAMAAAARRILTQPDLAEQLSRNGRRTVEQYDWETIFPEWESLLRSLIHPAEARYQPVSSQSS